MAKGGTFGFGRGVLPQSFVRCYSRRTLHLVSAGTRTAKSRYFNRVVLGLGNRTTAAWPWLHRQLSVSAVCASVPGKHARSEVWDPEPQEGTTSGSLESWPGLDISIGSDVPEVADVVSQGGEVVAAGLGCYTPVGLVQQSLEFLHVNAHMPWWVAIVTATVALRVAMLPVAIMMQRNAANLANLQPQLEVIQRRMLLYKEAGNPDAVAREVADLMKLYQKHNARPMRLFLMPFLQMPIFITFFVALRKMAQAPVVSMQSGGTLWFTDLTIPDPFFALPLLACGAFLSNIELGGESGTPSNAIHQKTKMFLRVSSVLILPISINFPTALFMYWVTNSVLTTVQILVFKIPHVRRLLRIPIINRQSTDS